VNNRTIYCGICRRDTTSDGSRCLDCNSPLRRAQSSRPVTIPQCKKCGCGQVSEVERLRYECRGCSSIFGVDDRLIAAESIIQEQPDRRLSANHHRPRKERR
jgi:uncharacterized protein with PIN domain